MAAHLDLENGDRMKAAWILLPALLLGAANAEAGKVYCDMKGGSMPDGTERTRLWMVVNSTVRKPQLPGQTKTTGYCSITYRSFGGMHRPIEIIPRRNWAKRSPPITACSIARTRMVRIWCRSACTGSDGPAELNRPWCIIASRSSTSRYSGRYFLVQPGGLVALIRRASFTSSLTAPVSGNDSPALSVMPPTICISFSAQVKLV